MNRMKLRSALKLHLFNKKASLFQNAGEQIFYSFMMFLMTIAIMGFFILLISNKSSIAEFPGESTANVILSRFTNVEECFAYVGESGQLHKNTVHLTKFTREQIDSCYFAGDVGYQFHQFEFYVPQMEVRLATHDYSRKIDYAIKKYINVVDAEGGFIPAELVIYVQESTNVKGVTHEVYS
jgi:hypothetical protein